VEGKVLGRWVIIEDAKIGRGTEIHHCTIIKSSEIGEDNKIWNFVNIYGSEIGNRNTISSFVEIGGSKIGDNCKIEAMVFIPLGVTIGNNVFIGPGVRFANDKYPKVAGEDWSWTVGEVKVENNVAIGIGSIILPNVKIGEHAFIAAGSLVSSDVPPHSFAMGRPASVVSLQVMKELGII
jgi:UDP-2-acetamido-3-amino-2,3-dideoxy-glucuronate N-acetyltransferase